MNVRNLVVTVLSLAMLSACGGRKTLERPTEAAGELSAKSASDVVSANHSSLVGSAVGTTDGSAISTVSNFGLNSALRVAGRPLALTPSSALGSCDPSPNPSTLTDADHDGIYPSVTFTLNCSGLLDGMLSVNGSYTENDKDDNSQYGGFTYSLNNVTVKYVLGDSSATAVVNASYESTKNADGTYTGKYDVEADSSGSLNGLDKNYFLGSYLDTVVTPSADGNTNPADDGALVLSGFIKARSSEVDVVLAVSSANLTYSSSCNKTNFNNGTLTLKDGKGNTVEFTYSNCTRTTKYNGATLY